MKTKKYRSKLEEKFHKDNPEFEYETIRLPYTKIHNYVPDFVNQNEKTIIETKGRFTSADRSKHLAIKAAYPDWKVTIVFQNPDLKLNKKSKTSCSDWCDKYGINWRKA